MPVGYKFTAAGVVATLIALSASIPEGVKKSVVALFVFIVVDTALGVTSALLQRQVSSRKLSKKLLGKLATYAGLMTIAGGAAYLGDNWGIMGSMVVAIMGIETLSIVENVVTLAAVSGVNLGPALPALSRLSKYLANTPDIPEKELKNEEEKH